MVLLFVFEALHPSGKFSMKLASDVIPFIFPFILFWIVYHGGVFSGLTSDYIRLKISFK